MFFNGIMALRILKLIEKNDGADEVWADIWVQIKRGSR